MDKISNKERLALLEMIYGKLVKINRYIYRTDVPEMPKQKVFNIRTGEVIEERAVIFITAHHGTEITGYQDNFDEYESHLVYSFPDYSANKKNKTLRVYNEDADLVLKIDYSLDENLTVSDFVLADDKVLLVVTIYSSTCRFPVYIYDRKTKTMKKEYMAASTAIKKNKRVYVPLDQSYRHCKSYELERI